jgi:large subunit ribosomal protein L4
VSTVKQDIVDKAGKKVGSIDLDEAIFAAVIKKDLVHQVVRWQRAKKRAGTHSALNRAAMTGGGKKPWKQKGTGNARAGSKNSPVWVGGAVAHGPQPRSYEFSVPKRVRKAAICSALSAKKQGGKLVVIDDLVVSGKTQEIQGVLSAVGMEKRGALIVLPEKNGEGAELVSRSSKNIPGVKTVAAAGVNVYDLVNADLLVCTKEGVEALQSRVAGTQN